MTDPGTSADNQQAGGTVPALPDSSGIPQTEVAANPLHDSADASSQLSTIHQGVFACESATGLAVGGSRIEIVPAFQAKQIYGLAQPLGGYAPWAPDLAQAKAALLANNFPKINIADHVLPILGIQQAISKMAIPPGLGLLKISSPAVLPAGSLPATSITRCILPAVGDLAFHQAISRMASSWDHGLLGISQQLAESYATLVVPHQDVIRTLASFASTSIAAAVSPVHFAAMGATAGLVDLLRSWRETAENGLGLLRRLARAAHGAALHARAAVLNGDDGPVSWFIETWLGMRGTRERIEAVSAALLEEGWDANIPEDPAHLLTDLRSRTARQARVLRPIWETRLNYRTIGRLDHTVVTSNGTLLTLADLVPDPQDTEDLALANECEEQRLRRVLSRLKPDELQVTNVYAERSELTWAEAARLAGAADPVAMGERVRRKLKRLGAEHNRRLVLRTGGA
jgi:hypothetical protein